MNNQEHNCLICNIEVQDVKFDECYKCFNRYFDSLEIALRKGE